MIPEPGFQKPIPYLLDTEERKSKTSFDCVLATAKSDLAPFLAKIK